MSACPCQLAAIALVPYRKTQAREHHAISREPWLLAHSELRTLRRIEAVMAWIEEVAPR